ncbi:MAG TPA: hypothetical protein VI072_17350 [Polyangiaceae bacterium]
MRNPNATLRLIEDVVEFTSGDFEVAPGDEKYICWSGRLPADRDVAVREIAAEYGPGTHHTFLGWTFLQDEPEGMTECPVLFKTTWIPIYLGGVATSPLKMPEGAAVDLERGKQLILQLHLQNTTRRPIVNRVKMRLTLQPEGDTFVPAGIYGLDNRMVHLPPQSTDVRTKMTCPANRAMNVFAILGHMHKLGSSLRVFKNGTETFNQPWNFDEQPITPFQMQVNLGDELGLECAHHNPTDSPVEYGESSETEMCATVFFYTPYTGISGCINAPPKE